MEQKPQPSARIELIGKYSAGLSLIEVALGSLLHALHIPFAGNFLSLNQGYLLCRAALEACSASTLGRRREAIMSTAISKTPTQIEMSATLKVGQ